ncbi:imidazole glycerol phosphate synthase subunit HisH [bacterium]|nr:imidazole glycerol phosphate synthase subunit HisH [bacterium]
MIVIIDYGMGNVGSIMNMLRKIGADAVISSDPQEIKGADKIILPGVGAFDKAMANLKKLKLIPVLEQTALKDKKPLLGICLGMQLLTKKSEEGAVSGLGFIDAETKRFHFEQENGLKVPHMGWNTVTVKRDDWIFKNCDQFDELRFYFVHSYHAVCANEANVLVETFYGYSFASAIQKGNIVGVQFHPEKSHKFGIYLMSNFAFGD